MSDPAREITGQFATEALAAAGSVIHGPYVAFKVLGAACTITTVGLPTISAVAIQQGDVVNGHWTTITHGGEASSVVIPYESAQGYAERWGLYETDNTTYSTLTVFEPAGLVSAPSYSSLSVRDSTLIDNETYITLNLDASN